MKFLSDILAKAGLTVDGVVTLNNTATGQTPDANDNSTKLATTAWVRTFVQPYSLPIASSSVLGGIKVGEGLTINSSTGVLSATGGSGSLTSFRSEYIITATAGQTTFNVPNGYTPGKIDLFLNGVYLNDYTYTATDSSTVVLDDAASLDDILTIFVYSTYYVGESPSARTTTYFTATNNQTVFTVDYVIGQVDIFYNGSKLEPTDYTANNGTSITLTNSCNTGDIIEVVNWAVGGGIAATRTLTINGITYDLSADRTWTLTTSNIAEGTNQYYTNARARAAISLTVTGTSGASTYDSGTGILNVPTYTLAGLGGVPTGRTLTIDGISYDLSANRTWNILPTGGAAGDILAKNSATNYDVTWIPNYTSQVQHIVKAAVAVTKGQAVYVSSADGTNMIVSKASNATEGTSSKTLGLVAQDLAINGQGFVVTEGLLAGLDTSTATAGDPVWLGTNGNLIFGLLNKPTAPAHLVFIGVVTRVQQNNGEIFVKVQNGFELDELHDLSVKNASDGDMIKYVASTGLWTKIAATTTNITEGTNLYYTQGRFNTAFGAKSTTDLSEGTNLYYTTARANSDFDTRFATKSTTNLTEGTNLYYTDARVGTYLTTNSYATQSYVSTQIANLVDSAPTTLDTLNELAAALGDDPNFATTVSTSIGTKVPQTRTITINGTAYDLSADRSWSIAAGVTSFNTRTGAITLTSGDVTGALGYTPYNSTNPSGYITGYTETDTLASVTGRGANTSTGITITATDASFTAQSNGTSEIWRGRIISKNSSSNLASFLGTYASVAGVFAHNNALDAWADLYINTVTGSTGGTVRMPSSVLVNGNQVIHAGNYSSYALPLSGGIMSGTPTFTAVYSNGSANDYTDISNPAYKVQVSSGYWRVVYKSASSTNSGVYNYETGKSVFWGEPSDTGNYNFRGRSLKWTNSASTEYDVITGANYGSYAVPLTGGTMSGMLEFSDSGTTRRGIYGTSGTNDQWFVGGGATSTNAGYLEISTGDDGTEPIYVRQYSGGTPFTGTLQRTLTLLSSAGNSSFPGSISAPEIFFTSSTNNAYFNGNSTWGVRITNDNGYIQFGPANNSWTHIYSDKSFYFNQELYVNGTQVVTNSGTWSINVSGSASTVTHYASRTDPTWYNVVWGAGNPSYLYSADGVQIQSSTNSLKAQNLTANGNLYAGSGFTALGSNGTYQVARTFGISGADYKHKYILLARVPTFGANSINCAFRGRITSDRVNELGMNVDQDISLSIGYGNSVYWNTESRATNAYTLVSYNHNGTNYLALYIYTAPNYYQGTFTGMISDFGSWLDSNFLTVVELSSANHSAASYNQYTSTIMGSTVWTAGNDGSGSGLDADLLDGYHAVVGEDQTGNNTKSKIIVTGPTGNLVVKNPESYSGEVRLGAAWDRGGIYAGGTLTMSTSSGNIDFVANNTVIGAIRWDATNGTRHIIGENVTTTPYTLVDSNKRPVQYLRGAYPVLTLDHTDTGNTSHGPTIQFVFNGLDARQWVIGSPGNGSRLDFGMSNAAMGNTNYNPHHGIAGYTGKTIMRLTETGVLVGDAGSYPTITSPTVALDVRGSIRMAGTLLLSGSGAEASNSTGARLSESYGPLWNLSNSSTWHHQVINGSYLCGFLASGGNYGGGNYYGTGDVTAYYSDERLKTKVSTITNAIEKIMSLEGFVYVENELAKSLGYNNQKEQAGVSAQQIQAVLPQAVSLAPFDMQGVAETGEIISKSGENYLTVKYDRIVPLLIEGIKELKAENDALKEILKRNNII